MYKCQEITIIIAQQQKNTNKKTSKHKKITSEIKWPRLVFYRSRDEKSQIISYIAIYETQTLNEMVDFLKGT